MDVYSASYASLASFVKLLRGILPCDTKLLAVNAHDSWHRFREKENARGKTSHQPFTLTPPSTLEMPPWWSSYPAFCPVIQEYVAFGLAVRLLLDDTVSDRRRKCRRMIGLHLKGQSVISSRNATESKPFFSLFVLYFLSRSSLKL